MRSLSALSRVASAAVAVLALGLTASPAIAAGSSADAADRGTSATSAMATETSADTRGGLRKCRDLRCKVTVRRGDSFFTNGTNGIVRVEFPKISPDRKRVIADLSVGSSQVCDAWQLPLRCRMGPYHNVRVTIKNVRGHRATARFWAE